MTPIRVSFIALLAAAFFLPMPAHAETGIIDHLMQAERQDRADTQRALLAQYECLFQSTQPDLIHALYQTADQFYQGTNGENTNKQPSTQRAQQDAQQMRERIMRALQRREGPNRQGLDQPNGPHCGQQSAELDQRQLDRLVIADITNDAWAAPPVNTMLASSQPHTIAGEIRACAIDFKSAAENMTLVDAGETTSVGSDGRILANPVVAAKLIVAGAIPPVCPKGSNGQSRCEEEHWKNNQKPGSGTSQKQPPRKQLNCDEAQNCAQ